MEERSNWTFQVLQTILSLIHHFSNVMQVRIKAVAVGSNREALLLVGVVQAKVLQALVKPFIFKAQMTVALNSRRSLGVGRHRRRPEAMALFILWMQFIQIATH
jgi:hypothetical protein